MGTVDFSKIKVLVADGDSWTAGEIIDPKLVDLINGNIMHKDNDAYRLPKVWPHKLASKLGVECINIGEAGSSNDGIVRRTVNKLENILKKYKTEEILYIIGWSSPERKDFFFTDEKHRAWETLYPGEFESFKSENKRLLDFYKRYTVNFWNPEEFICRYIHHNLYLHTYLESKNIKHLFFNAFYEERAVLESDEHTLKFSIPLEKEIEKLSENLALTKFLNLDNLIVLYKDLVFKNYLKESFVSYIVKKEKELEENIITYHPNEKGHDLWANYIYESIK